MYVVKRCGGQKSLFETVQWSLLVFVATHAQHKVSSHAR